MKKWICTALIFLCLALLFYASPFSLSFLTCRLTLRLCQNELFSEVFGLDEEEAVEVFADENGAAFL